jgi:hypothetical protein
MILYECEAAHTQKSASGSEAGGAFLRGRGYETITLQYHNNRSVIVQNILPQSPISINDISLCYTVKHKCPKGGDDNERL